MTEFHAGDIIAGYTVTGVCGCGSYGEVYRVSDSLGTELALKVLTSGKNSERELSALIRFRACRHPNLLTVLHVGKLPDGRIFYTMDLADSRNNSPEYDCPDTLAARMAGQTFAPDEAEKILRELLAGLDELHRAHLLHRDIKPGNILFIRGCAVLADIGLVTNDASASLIGTPDYLPEELLKSHRPMTAADDCYALGLILYGMLTGESPSSFPSVPNTLRDTSALRLLKIAEKACTSPGFPDASAFLEQLDHPVLSGKKHGAWKWIVAGCVAVLAIFFSLIVRQHVRAQTGNHPAYMQGASVFPEKMPSPELPTPAVSPAKSEKTSAPSANVPTIYAPEVASLLKKYQLSEAEEAERNRRLALFRKWEADENARFRQRIAEAGQWTSAEAVNESIKREMEEDRKSRRRYEMLLDASSVPSTAEMEIESLLEKIGSDTPTQSELLRLEKALQRRKQAYSAKNL